MFYLNFEWLTSARDILIENALPRVGFIPRAKMYTTLRLTSYAGNKAVVSYDQSKYTYVTCLMELCNVNMKKSKLCSILRTYLHI